MTGSYSSSRSGICAAAANLLRLFGHNAHTMTPPNSTKNHATQSVEAVLSIWFRSISRSSLRQRFDVDIVEADHRAQHLQVGHQSVHLRQPLRVARKAVDPRAGIALQQSSGVLVGIDLQQQV